MRLELLELPFRADVDGSVSAVEATFREDIQLAVDLQLANVLAELQLHDRLDEFLAENPKLINNFIPKQRAGTNVVGRNMRLLDREDYTKMWLV